MRLSKKRSIGGWGGWIGWIALVSIAIPISRGQTTTVSPPIVETTPTVSPTSAQTPEVPAETNPPSAAPAETEPPTAPTQTEPPSAATSTGAAPTDPPTTVVTSTAAAQTEPPTTVVTSTAAAQTELPTTVVTDPSTTAAMTTEASVAEPSTTAATPTETNETEPSTTVATPTGAAETEPPSTAQTSTAASPTAAAQTESPSTSTTQTPTAAADLPVREPLPCFSSLTALDDVERAVTDLDQVRPYILCANTTFFTGFLTTNGDILGGDKPLTLRKNMHIHCGEVGGSSTNNCIVSRGSFGLTSIPNNFQPPTFNDNVIVQGVTFENAALYGVLLGLGGTFQFIDCIFKNHKSSAVPILVEWEGGSIGGGAAGRQLKSPQGRYEYSPLERVVETDMAHEEANRELQISTLLTVEFIDCLFKDSECAADSRLGLINLGGDGIDVKFDGCAFQNNDFNIPGINDAFNYGVIIENFGNGALSFNSTCFVDNKALGNGLVASYGTELPAVSNDFGSDNEVQFLTELECEFVALVDVSNDTFPNVACADFDTDTCSFVFVSEPPTPAPVDVEPTMAPANGATPTPVAEGSAMPVPSTDSLPTLLISEDPTSGASEIRHVLSALLAASLFAVSTLA